MAINPNPTLPFLYITTDDDGMSLVDFLLYITFSLFLALIIIFVILLIHSWLYGK